MRKKGISLIVLIVTIIVIIILAAVVVLTISKNNPIESAKEAAFKEDVRTFQDELAMYISKDYTAKAGARDDKITATNYNPSGDPASVYTYIPSFSKKYEGKFVIKNDELMYKEEMLQQEKIWCQSLNVKENIKTGAEKAKEDPQNYYGAKVTNYTANGISDWKIFYSDGYNLFLITSEYVDPAKLPEKDGAKPSQLDKENHPKAPNINSVTNKYIGSSDITDEIMKVFNSDYYAKGYTSETSNMKKVAYMLDKDIWREFSKGTGAEYAVGGPSIEMLLKSYSEKKKVDYKAQAVSATGYKISNNGEENYVYSITNMLNSNETLYVQPLNSGADAMLLASPSAAEDWAVIDVFSSGYVNSYSYYTGFRPVVCLKSDAVLTKVSNTEYRID